MGEGEKPDLAKAGDGVSFAPPTFGARIPGWGAGGEALWSRLKEPG